MKGGVVPFGFSEGTPQQPKAASWSGKSNPVTGQRPTGARARRGLTFAERKEYEQIVFRIDDLEHEKTRLEKFFSEHVQDADEMERNTRRYAELTSELEESMTRWEELALRDSEGQG